jgi:hypothetical protein
MAAAIASSRAASDRPAVGPDTVGVNCPEGRSGQGYEHTRMLAYRLGDTLAAGEPGADEVVCICLVDP